MHYNNSYKRAKIEEDYRQKGIELFDTKQALGVYINLCIYPQRWEWVYDSIRTKGKITDKCYLSLLGAMYGLLIHLKRAKSEASRMSAEIAPDIIDFIRSDNVGDPWKFLLSMRRYFPRYLIMRGLSSFSLDWKELAVEIMGARSIPAPKSYHSLFTNIYIRTIVKALVVFVAVREINDEDYQLGVNDLTTLLDRESASSKCKSKEVLEVTYFRLRESLPSWSPQVRGQVAYYLSNLLSLNYLTEKQLFGRLHENTIGTKNDW